MRKSKALLKQFKKVAYVGIAISCILSLGACNRTSRNGSQSASVAPQPQNPAPAPTQTNETPRTSAIQPVEVLNLLLVPNYQVIFLKSSTSDIQCSVSSLNNLLYFSVQARSSTGELNILLPLNLLSPQFNVERRLVKKSYMNNHFYVRGSFANNVGFKLSNFSKCNLKLEPKPNSIMQVGLSCSRVMLIKRSHLLTSKMKLSLIGQCAY